MNTDTFDFEVRLHGAPLSDSAILPWEATLREFGVALRASYAFGGRTFAGWPAWALNDVATLPPATRELALIAIAPPRTQLR